MSFNGPLRHNPKNSRYFTDDSGKAVYLTGSHTWSVMQDMWLETDPRHNTDYDGFLQMMAEYGHNFMRFWQFALYTKNAPWNVIPTCFDPMPFARTGPGLANDGLPKFDLNKFNETYFSRLGERVKKAADFGIYTSIMLFEAWALKWATPDQQPWEHHVFNPDNNINNITDNPLISSGRYAGNYIGLYSLDCPQILDYQKSFIRTVVDTVNDLDNVLYEICNEVPDTPQAEAWQAHLCEYLRSYEKTQPKQHMIGITAEGGDQVTERIFSMPADWISPASGKGFEYRYNPPITNGKKVIITDSDHLWGHGCETGWIWKSFTRGMNILFMDPWEPIPGDLDWWQDGDVSMNQRFYYKWEDVRRNMGYARNLALRFDMNACVPDTEFCTSTYCLANFNQQYICYFPTGGTEGVDLTGLDGVFQIAWFNPVTGITTPGKTLKVDKATADHPYQRAALSAPFVGSAVLLIYKDLEKASRKHEIVSAGN